MSFISKLILKLGFGNSFFRKIAGSAALALSGYLATIDVAMTTEVFGQIISGVVMLLAGASAPQLGNDKK